MLPDVRLLLRSRKPRGEKASLWGTREYLGYFRFRVKVRADIPRFFFRVTFVAVTLALILPFPMLVRLKDRRYFSLSRDPLRRTDYDKMRRSSLPSLRTLPWLREVTSKDARFLVFRMGDFLYYANRQILRDVDPRMAAVYRATSVEEVHRRLLALGVDYVFVPNYLLPTVTQTPLMDLFLDPSRLRLIFSSGGERLFRLNTVEEAVKREPIALANAQLREPPSGKHLPGWRVDVASDSSWSVDENAGILHVDNRSASVGIVENDGPVSAIPPGTAEYHFSALVQGTGFASLSVKAYGDQFLWNGLLPKVGRRVGGTFRAAPGTGHPMRVVFRVFGRSRMSVSDLRLHRVTHPVPLGREESVVAQWQ